MICWGGEGEGEGAAPNRGLFGFAPGLLLPWGLPQRRAALPADSHPLLKVLSPISWTALKVSPVLLHMELWELLRSFF